MVDKTSSEISRKARKMFEERKVEIEFDAEKRVHFKVQGDTEMHSVVFDKEKKQFTCDCKYYALRLRDCSHIMAARILMESTA